MTHQYCSTAVVHNYNREQDSEAHFKELSLAGFTSLGVEVDIGSSSSEQAVVIDRVAKACYEAEIELPKIRENFSGPIILDITERRAWPAVDKIIHADDSGLSYDNVTLAISNLVCTYFGEPHSQEDLRYSLPSGGFGLVFSHGALLEAKHLHQTGAMQSLFWLPDPRGTEDLIDYIKSHDQALSLYYFLPFTSPTSRLADLSPAQVIKEDLIRFNAHEIDFIPIGKSDDLLRFKEIHESFFGL